MMYVDPIAHRAWSPSEIELNSPAREKLALKELEQLFIHMLMKEMRRTVPESEGLFEASSEMKTYQEMMDDVISEKMAEAGQFGLAKMIGEQLRIQELVNEAAPTAEAEPIPFTADTPPIDLGDPESMPIPLEDAEQEFGLIPLAERKPFAL